MAKELPAGTHRNLSVKISKAESNMVDKLRKHYGFTSDTDLIRALIARGAMNL